MVGRFGVVGFALGSSVTIGTATSPWTRAGGLRAPGPVCPLERRAADRIVCVWLDYGMRGLWSQYELSDKDS